MGGIRRAAISATIEEGIDPQIEDVVLEGEHAVAAGGRYPMAEVPLSGRGRFEPKHGETN